MYADRVFEFGVALAATIGVDCAVLGRPRHDQGWTFGQRHIFRMGPRR